MKLTSGSKVAITLAAMTLALFAFRLYFRAFVYEGMYIAPEDPYGIADVIELMLVFLFFGLFVVSVVFSMFMFFRGAPQSRKASWLLLFFFVVLLVSYPSLHRLAASW